MESYERGSSILFEVEFQKQVPFGGLVYFDPSTATITVVDNTGTKVVDAQNLTKSTLGKYYYIAQSLTNWLVGIYYTSVTASDGTYSDVLVQNKSFKLI